MPHHFVGDFPVWTVPMGNGANRALLLHCALARSGVWTPMMAKLGVGLSAIAMDLPGHGRSGDWDGTGDYHDLALSLALDVLGQTPADLIGHSLGATLALRLALARPDLVRSLTLIEPVYFAAAQGTVAAKRHAASQQQFSDPLLAGDTVTATRYFVGLWGDGRDWEALAEAERAYCMDRIHLIPATERQLVGDAAKALAPGRLEALTMPVLLLQGADSPPIIDAIHTALAARLPDARRVVVPGASHMLPVTHPAETAQEIAAFLRL